MQEIETIMFANGPQSGVSALGRNGVMDVIGVVVEVGHYHPSHPFIRLTPINSRKVPGRCFIEIPLTSETIETLVHTLTTVVNQQCQNSTGN